MSSNIAIQRICQYCSSEFIARTTVTQYCSHTCSKKAWKKKNRDQKIEKSNLETIAVKAKPIEQIKEKEFLTVPDLAMLLNCSKRTAYYLIKRGTINAVKISDRITLIKRSEVDKLFQQPVINSVAPEIPIQFNEAECYNLADVRKQYSISQTALRNLIIKHEVPTFYKGWFAFAPKVEIDKLFTSAGTVTK